MHKLDIPGIPPMLSASMSAAAPSLAGPSGSGMDPSADIYGRLLKNRIVYLGSEVNDEVANFLTAQLLYLLPPGPIKGRD